MAVQGLSAPHPKEDAPKLEEFYIVQSWEDDYYPYWQATVLHAAPDSRGSLVRYIYVQSATALCGRPEIGGVEALLTGFKVQELAGKELCTLDPATVDKVLAGSTREPEAFETGRSAVVVRCGGTDRVFQLAQYKTDEKALKRKSPKIATLFELAARVRKRAFGDTLPSWPDFGNPPRGLAPTFAADLLAGRYDAGFWHCVEGVHPAIPAMTVGPGVDPLAGSGCDVGKLKNVLSSYIEPKDRELKPRVRVGLGWKLLLEYVPPEISAELVQNEAHGVVWVKLTADPETGAVKDVLPTILGAKLQPARGAIIEAARQWRLKPSPELEKPVSVQLWFDFECEQKQR